MKRVLEQTSIKSIGLLLILFLALAQSSLATTVIVPSDDDMVIGARAILRGKVVAIESSFDERSGHVYTYITVKVREVLKGQISERKIVLKELGGQVGDRMSVIYGNPQFKKGEKVLLYLDTWADGSLRTHQMFLGKFNIVKDPGTGREIAVRSSPDENTTVLKHQFHGHGAPGPSTERLELSRYLRMVRNRLTANWERSLQFEAEAYANVPLLAEPAEYGSIAGKGDFRANFTFLGPFRFFEPDTGQPVSVLLNPNPSEEQGVPQVVLNSADVVAAGNAWTNVSGSSLQMLYGGTMEQCYAFGSTPGVHVVSNNCDGRNGPSSGCSGLLAWGGVRLTGPLTRTINGTNFRQTIQGFVSMNPWAACSFTVNCNVQEILTHEIGHAIGLGHSQFSDATMAPFAHFDGRCASIRTDDADGIRAIYPGSGGGPGPLTITTSSLASGTVGSPYSQTVIASGGTPPYGWSLVAGLGTLPTGLGLSAGGAITGTPGAVGTYNFSVRVTDNAGGSAQKALSIVIGGGGASLNSQFVSQTVPTSVQPDQVFSVNMRFLNTGTQTWSGSAYFIASQNPALNQTWGGNGVPLSAFVAGPGELLNVDFNARAPSAPGIYNFQWQMYQNFGAGFFGQVSTNAAVSVGTQPNYQGFHDGAGCNTIQGWAWDPASPNSTVNVDIYDGTTLIGTAAANMYREDLLNALGSPNHGFSFLTPTALKNGATHSISVKFSGTNTLLSNSNKTIQCSLQPVFIGRHDGQGCNAIEGWAWNSNDSTGTLSVDLYDGATLIGSTAATLYRQDLADVFGSPYHGFIFHPPASLKDGQTHMITVKYGGTNINLPDSPRPFTCTNSTPNYQGNLDVADCNWISGYAWDANDDNTINVAIYADGNFLVVVPAQQTYPGIGNGFHGFKFAVPASLKNGQPHTIQVRFSGTATNLSNSPKTITCSP